jgi:hypothetical protein
MAHHRLEQSAFEFLVALDSLRRVIDKFDSGHDPAG